MMQSTDRGAMMRSTIHGSRGFRRLPVSLTLALAAPLVVYGVAMGSARQERGRVIPAPAAEEAPSQAKSETAVLAGGCFWGVQAVFQHVKGVTRAVSGYAGGQKNAA